MSLLPGSSIWYHSDAAGQTWGRDFFRDDLIMWLRTLGRVSLIVSLCALSIRAAEPDPAFREAKQFFQVQMRKKIPLERIAGVNKLAEFANNESADLLSKKGLLDSDSDVRKAAQAAVRTLAVDDDIRKHLVDEVKRAFRKPVISDAAIAILGALAPLEKDDQKTELLKILDEYLTSTRANLLIPITLIDEFGKQGDAEAFHAVTFFSKSKAFGATFGYRRAVVQAMTQIRHPEAVSYLILLIPESQGMIQYDIVQYLTKLTAQKFGDNDREWYKWWREKKETFEFPKAGVPTEEVPLKDAKLTYYGIPVCAKRVVFVLDTSGSMRGAPIASAKAALVAVIEKLPAEVNFDVVMFDKSATVWQPRLLPATNSAKTEVISLIRNRGLANGTASFAALEAAFKLEPEAIYFLSDGRPTDSQPDQIYNTLYALNRTRRVSLYTFGLSSQQNAADLILFMKPLAEQNFGTFRIVE